MQSPEAIRDELRGCGFAVARSAAPDGLVAVLAALGEVIRVSEVRLNPAVRSYLAGPEPIPPHTDHPQARYIAWMCRENDPSCGENLLVDGHAVLDALPPVLRQSLAAARFGCPPLDRMAHTAAAGGIPMRPHPVWDEQRRTLFFAPWLPRSVDDAEPLAQLARSLDHAPRQRVRLEPEDMLVVDNSRILHARQALPPGSRRWLTRYWIKSEA